MFYLQELMDVNKYNPSASLSVGCEHGFADRGNTKQ